MSDDATGPDGPVPDNPLPDGPVVPELDGVPVTALITLYSRGSESARPDAVLRDDLARRTLESLDFPFEERFGAPDQHAVIRALQFDRVVRSTLAAHPGRPWPPSARASRRSCGGWTTAGCGGSASTCPR